MVKAPQTVDSAMHRKRLSRNVGTGVVLGALAVILLALSFVKLREVARISAAAAAAREAASPATPAATGQTP